MCKRFATLVKFALAMVVFLAAPLAANGQPVRYRVVPLSDPAPNCIPVALNANGDVVGYCNGGALEAFAVLWPRAGGVQDLGKFDPRSTFSRATAINSLGQVVGDSDDGDFQPMAMVHKNGQFVQVDGSGNSMQFAYGIMDDGTIIGNFTTQGGSIGTIDWDPVYWVYDAAHDRYDRFDMPKPPALPQPVGVKPLSGAFIWAASTGGYAAGDVTSDIVGNQAGFWSNDAARTLTVLGLPTGYTSAFAQGVSNDGRAAGTVFGFNSAQHAVLWLNDAAHSAIDLGALPGDPKSSALGVNNSGHVVGVSYNGSNLPRGFIYRNGGMVELTSLLDAVDAGWTIDQPAGINDNGEIIAVGTLSGVRRPVKLVPYRPFITSVAVSANQPAPQPPGTVITLTAAASGGLEPYEYKFWIYDGVSWTVGQNWGASASFAWTPAVENRNYRVYAFARSAGNTAEGGEKNGYVAFPVVNLISSVTLTANRTAPQAPGTSVTFSAAATGGTAPYQFKFWLYDGATWSIGQNWSTSSSFTWTPVTANRNYRIYAFARSAGNTADAAEKMGYMSFPIVSLITSVTMRANLSAPQPPGSSVTFSAEATGGVAPYQFKFWIYDGSTWSIGQNWSTTATFTWTPVVANRNYRVYAFARSAGNTADAAEKFTYMSFAITALIENVTLTANLPAPQAPGTSVTFTAAATGGVGPHQFKFWLYDGSSWTIGQDWSTATTFTWTPATANKNYRIYVFARSAGNTADAAEKMAHIQFPIVTP